MTASACALATRHRVAGHETAERRRRLGVTRRALASASGVASARLSAHEGGRIALDVEELQAIEGVLSPRERELGLPSVRLDYVPAANASEERDERIRADILRILFGNRSARSWAESPPGEPPQKERAVAAPLATAQPSPTSTATRPLSSGGRCARRL
jgi:transcriptional regulator with XRE-family HTH domain